MLRVRVCQCGCQKPESLVGKDVLVIGGGNSACDIAVEAGEFVNVQSN